MSDAILHGPGTTPLEHDDVELRKEAYTMALYVAICLPAALSAVSEHAGSDDLDAFKIGRWRLRWSPRCRCCSCPPRWSSTSPTCSRCTERHGHERTPAFAGQ